MSPTNVNSSHRHDLSSFHISILNISTWLITRSRCTLDFLFKQHIHQFLANQEMDTSNQTQMFHTKKINWYQIRLYVCMTEQPISVDWQQRSLAHNWKKLKQTCHVTLSQFAEFVSLLVHNVETNLLNCSTLTWPMTYFIMLTSIDLLKPVLTSFAVPGNNSPFIKLTTEVSYIYVTCVHRISTFLLMSACGY